MAFLIPTLASFLLPVLALGPVPRHIGFIMDGNRRWASSHKTSIRTGHVSGFEALKRVLESCLALDGLECISVYAFAIDNFKRSQEEVDALMDLASTRLLELASHGQVVAKHCVRVRIIGRTELLPDHVQAAVRKIEALTRNNDKALLNICIPYAARDEMTAAVRTCLTNRLEHKLAHQAESESDGEAEAEATTRWSSTSSSPASPPQTPHHPITAQELDAHMMFAHAPPLDLLVRTSGVHRLSDFMLWQCASSPSSGAGGAGGAQDGGTHLAFVSCFWPQFGLRHLIPILLDYQRAVWARRRQKAGRVGASRRVGRPALGAKAGVDPDEGAHDLTGSGGHGHAPLDKRRSYGTMLLHPFVVVLLLLTSLGLLVFHLRHGLQGSA